MMYNLKEYVKKKNTFVILPIELLSKQNNRHLLRCAAGSQVLRLLLSIFLSHIIFFNRINSAKFYGLTNCNIKNLYLLFNIQTTDYCKNLLQMT